MVHALPHSVIGVGRHRFVEHAPLDGLDDLCDAAPVESRPTASRRYDEVMDAFPPPDLALMAARS
jgi:hypothetical protein